MPGYPSKDEAIASFEPAELAKAIESAHADEYQSRRDVVTLGIDTLTPKQSAALAALAAAFGPDARCTIRYGVQVVTMPKTFEELKDTVLSHRQSLLYSQRQEAEKPDSIIEP